MINNKFGRLTVIKFDKDKSNIAKRKYWMCICECGKSKSIQEYHLKSGATTSCGCYQKQRASETKFKHGGKGTSLYNRWKSMRQRCNNPKNIRYKDYGSRGIAICDEWNDFATFYNWSISNGYRDDYEIDRIDNDGNYEPNNCRWVSVLENNHNRRITVKVSGKTLKEISEEYEIDYTDIHYRYYRLKKSKETISINDLIA